MSTHTVGLAWAPFTDPPAVRVPPSDQLEALRVEAVPLPAGHGLQQRLLLLGAARRLQLVHGGQVEEDALVEVERRVLLHQALQLAQGLLQPPEVEQADRCVVVGLETRRSMTIKGPVA